MLEERKCPKCGKVYLPPMERCLNDNQTLFTTNTLVGRVLDRYRIDKVLGVGGMGAVYRSLNLDLDKEYAVKVLHPEMMEREDLFERFRNEAKAASRIEHPKVVKVTYFGVQEPEKLAFLVMELVEGKSLRTLLEKSGLDWERAVEILCQTCEAVEAAHQRNIIHRDLKPDNIIVHTTAAGDQVKVLDFGIAKLREVDEEGVQQGPQTKIGQIVGTPQYMSPEQCRGVRGEDLKATSDVYSLGVIAYELLSGRLPFISASTLGFISMHAREPAPPLQIYAPQTPPEIEAVVMSALEKDAVKRQQTAVQLAEELRAAAQEVHLRASNPTQKVVVKTPVFSPAPVTLPVAPHKTGDRQVAPPNDDPLHTKITRPPRRWLKWAGGSALLIIAAAVGLYLAQPVPPLKPPPKPSPAPSAALTTISDEFGTMVLQPAGAFEMGRNDGEDDEAPRHRVELKAFYLDKTEVTNQQYKKFVDATGRRAPASWPDGKYVPENALLPVTGVTWSDATAYAQWARKRLPTEEEWEYAARGGEAGRLYPWGDQWQEGYANTNRLGTRLAAVGSFDRDLSRFGVYDLGGNVSEWVQSNYWRYGGSPQTPVDKTCPDCKVYRGGNFGREGKTNTFRWSFVPDVPSDSASARQYREEVFPAVGFRCARDYVGTN